MNQIAISLIVSGVLLLISNTIYQRAKERGKDIDMIYLPLLIAAILIPFFTIWENLP